MIYRYDGSFEGFLCCVFESYSRSEIPEDILPEGGETTLYAERPIAAERAAAAQVYRGIEKKGGRTAAELVAMAFLCGIPGKETPLFRFIRLLLRVGGRAVDMLGDEAVNRVHAMARAVGNEKHLLLGFARFSEYSDGETSFLAAEIEPKHFVLPLMQGHFCGRYPEERFLIYDKTHAAMLIYQPYEARLIRAEWEPPAAGAAELDCRRLWKRYYDTIAISERENPKCRMGHMPKRFWSHITELQEPEPLRGTSLEGADSMRLS